MAACHAESRYPGFSHPASTFVAARHCIARLNQQRLPALELDLHRTDQSRRSVRARVGRLRRDHVLAGPHQRGDIRDPAGIVAFEASATFSPLKYTSQRLSAPTTAMARFTLRPAGTVNTARK